MEISYYILAAFLVPIIMIEYYRINATSGAPTKVTLWVVSQVMRPFGYTHRTTGVGVVWRKANKLIKSVAVYEHFHGVSRKIQATLGVIGGLVGGGPEVLPMLLSLW